MFPINRARKTTLRGSSPRSDDDKLTGGTEESKGSAIRGRALLSFSLQRKDGTALTPFVGRLRERKSLQNQAAQRQQAAGGCSLALWGGRGAGGRRPGSGMAPLVRGGGGLTSPQGTTGMDLQGVASNGEIYVVVGDAGTIAYSSDGNRWVEASSFGATENWLNDVVWGNDRFVAVGDYAIIHSSDGDRWQSARRVDWYSLASVAWGNHRFVAVRDGGTAGNELPRKLARSGWCRVGRRSFSLLSATR